MWKFYIFTILPTGEIYISFRKLWFVSNLFDFLLQSDLM